MPEWRRSLSGLLGLALCLSITEVFAFSDSQLEAIRQLGDLNAIALHCGRLPETQRMKRALVTNLPKRRQLGELFDVQTHEAYLRLLEAQTACPTIDDLGERVSAAIRHLEQEYAGQTTE